MFREVDPMAIVWHGRYAELFEDASTELRRQCGLSYEEFLRANLRAPVVQLHVEYCRPLYLDETASVRASLFWTEAARLNIGYEVLNEEGRTAATGWTVQLFTDADSGAACLLSPAMLEQCRERWRNGGLRHLQ
jgi:acyl-CoA thioester hydrolase